MVRRVRRSSIDPQLRVAHSRAPLFYFQLDPGAERIRCRAGSSIVQNRDQNLAWVPSELTASRPLAILPVKTSP